MTQLELFPLLYRVLFSIKEVKNVTFTGYREHVRFGVNKKKKKKKKRDQGIIFSSFFLFVKKNKWQKHIAEHSVIKRDAGDNC